MDCLSEKVTFEQRYEGGKGLGGGLLGERTFWADPAVSSKAWRLEHQGDPCEWVSDPGQMAGEDLKVGLGMWDSEASEVGSYGRAWRTGTNTFCLYLEGPLWPFCGQ